METGAGENHNVVAVRKELLFENFIINFVLVLCGLGFVINTWSIITIHNAHHRLSSWGVCVLAPLTISFFICVVLALKAKRVNAHVEDVLTKETYTEIPAKIAKVYATKILGEPHQYVDMISEDGTIHMIRTMVEGNENKAGDTATIIEIPARGKGKPTHFAISGAM